MVNRYLKETDIFCFDLFYFLFLNSVCLKVVENFLFEPCTCLFHGFSLFQIKSHQMRMVSFVCVDKQHIQTYQMKRNIVI